MPAIRDVRCVEINSLEIADKLLDERLMDVMPVLIFKYRLLLLHRDWLSSLRGALQDIGFVNREISECVKRRI